MSLQEARSAVKMVDGTERKTKRIAEKVNGIERKPKRVAKEEDTKMAKEEIEELETIDKSAIDKSTNSDDEEVIDGKKKTLLSSGGTVSDNGVVAPRRVPYCEWSPCFMDTFTNYDDMMSIGAELEEQDIPNKSIRFCLSRNGGQVLW